LVFGVLVVSDCAKFQKKSPDNIKLARITWVSLNFISMTSFKQM
jgi:hypothetical protein